MSNTQPIEPIRRRASQEPAKPTSLLAIAALVTSLFALVAAPFACLFPILFVQDRGIIVEGGMLVMAVTLAPIALALSARSAIRRNPNLGGDVMAVVAMFFSILGFVISAISFRWGFACHWTPPR